MKLRVFWAIVLIFSLLTFPAAAATETEAVEIHTVSELKAMADNPSGSYILMEDLDMSGVDWTPINFTGSFDGNGHALLNLTLSQLGSDKPSSYDGNKKEYETAYAGFFGTLIGAEVKNLQLINVRGVIESDEPCFVAGLAGYSEGSTITNCTVTGCLELRAHDRMFGIGGVVGYGSGSVVDSKIDVTLICVDTDAETKDEQFLGGVYATGFMDVKNCEVIIDGYVSEHGYCHNGGIVGMYMEYPLGVGQKGYITDNSVTGKITFFEDNADRRAYCKAYVGEALVNTYYLDRNTEDFLRDEVKTYDVELRPEMCQNPTYTETVIEPGCDTYGYTIYQCSNCEYCYADHYTKFAHTVTDWKTVKAPTVEQEGLSEGACDGCGTQLQRTEPKLEPIPTTTAAPETQAPTEAPVVEQPKEETAEDKTLLYAAAVDGVLALAALLIVGKLRRDAKKNRRKGRFDR